ncbi:hypothetical protein M758_9G133300 [Ceratodon purpureus]|nr:hypothetical protein M758_9G133300 [Ceratodon purpureus]
MLQLGCFRASATLTSFSFSTGQSLNAPPEAVRMIRLNPPLGSPWMHSCYQGLFVGQSDILSSFNGCNKQTTNDPMLIFHCEVAGPDCVVQREGE